VVLNIAAAAREAADSQGAENRVRLRARGLAERLSGVG